MRKYLFNVLCLFALFLTACDSHIHLEGRILDNDSRKPIEGVQIRLGRVDSTQTNADGYFAFNKTLHGSVYTQMHLLLTKSGYEQSYSYVDKGMANVELVMAKSNVVKPAAFSKNTVKWMCQVQLVLIYVCLLFSIIFLFIRKIRYKFVWILIMLSHYFSLHLSYIDGKFSHWSFQYPLFIQHYWTHPFTIEVIIPTGLLAFWVYYWFQRIK